MRRNEIDQRIEELKMLIFNYEDKEYVTEKKGKEEQLIDAVVEAFDNLKFFYTEQKDKADKLNIEPLDQGYEYMMAIRANVAHRM